MGKSKREKKGRDEAPAAPTTANTSIVDPTLAALFASSSGPVTIPQRPVRASIHAGKAIRAPSGAAGAAEDTSSSENEDEEEAHENGKELSSENETEPEEINDRPRKRRKFDADEDLESRYLNKLVQEEEQEFIQKTKQAQSQEEGEVTSSEASSDLNSDLQDLSDSDSEPVPVIDDDDAIPKHESLTNGAHSIEAEKNNRTVFLGNIPTSCIKSKSSKKALVQHLQSAIDKATEKIESIRFRSTAFVSDAGPKRAAYAKKELMEETMKSTNAYAVLSSEAAARKIANRLNGTVVLDRHLRADYLGQPARVDHKRCVFVGNLSFVDAATALDEDGEQKRKRAKDPADVEEGLWRTFGKCGKVESVRVIRDKETRISKGFAYVQFENENAVESALLMDGKKFPPMLPRLLRVSRAKREMKKERREKFGTSQSSRKPHQGNTIRTGLKRKSNDAPTPREAVFEGHRASSGSLPKGLKKIKKRPAVKPTNRSSKRGAAFKASGGKKKRDMAA